MMMMMMMIGVGADIEVMIQDIDGVCRVISV